MPSGTQREGDRPKRLTGPIGTASYRGSPTPQIHEHPYSTPRPSPAVVIRGSVERLRRLAAVWIATALVLGAALAIGERSRDPLDDPDPAYQRPGALDVDRTSAGARAPEIAGGLPRPGAPAVVFFVRSEQLPILLRALGDRSPLHAPANVLVVLEGTDSPEGSVADALVVEDPRGRISAAYAMPRPADGGPPVGYAIVDRFGVIRYRTLDPGLPHRLADVNTLVRATP